VKALRKPQCVVLAGPNGAGKTSAAADLLRDTVRIDSFVNADVIAQGLSGFRPDSAAFEAGRILLHRLAELTQARDDFAFESTLSGRSAARVLKNLTASGYEVHLCYLWLPSPEMSVARVRRRVESGGHDVPEAVIRRRFWKSLINFDRLYRPVATTWRLYDGSVPVQRPLIAHGQKMGEPIVVDGAKWLEIRRRIEEMG
jgi:predicted ABC-type ATPase